MTITIANKGSQTRTGRLPGANSSVIRSPQSALSQAGSLPRHATALHPANAPKATRSSSWLNWRLSSMEAAANDRKQLRTTKNINFGVMFASFQKAGTDSQRATGFQYETAG